MWAKRCKSSAVAWLGAVGSILLMDYDGTPLDAKEWAELRDSLNLESGDLELELLSYAMGLVLEHGAI